MAIEALAYELETELIAAIAKALSCGALGTADWKIKKLGQLNTVGKKTMAIITRYRARILQGINQETEGAVESLIAEIRASLPINLSRRLAMTPGMRNIVDVWARSAKSQVNLAMAKLAQSAGASYVAAVNKASLGLITGEATHREALQRAVSELDSLTAFVDKAGRHWSPEGYISTVLRSNSGRAVNQAQMQAAEDLDTDLVEVTQHEGARPKCAPWQGEILSLNGETKTYNGHPVKTLAETSHGEIDGLLGVNCGHRLIPFIPGVSKRSHGLDMTAKENREAYQESQEQRQLERSIRSAKREQVKWESYGDKEKAAQWGERVKDRQASMREFIDETGRTRRYDREKVY